MSKKLLELSQNVSEISKNLWEVCKKFVDNCRKFLDASNRVMRLLVEESLAYLPYDDTKVETACGTYNGCKTVAKEAEGLTAVSILRSGNVLLEAVREVVPEVSVGYVLVQRDESDPEKKPKFFYEKFPANMNKKDHVLLCDPMLATGGSAIAAIQRLVDAGKFWAMGGSAIAAIQRLVGAGKFCDAVVASSLSLRLIFQPWL